MDEDYSSGKMAENGLESVSKEGIYPEADLTLLQPHFEIDLSGPYACHEVANPPISYFQVLSEF